MIQSFLHKVYATQSSTIAFKVLKELWSAFDHIFCFRYIVFNVPVHANATLSIVNHWFSVSEILSWVSLDLRGLQKYWNWIFRAMCMFYTQCQLWLFVPQFTWPWLSLSNGKTLMKRWSLQTQFCQVEQSIEKTAVSLAIKFWLKPLRNINLSVCSWDESLIFQIHCSVQTSSVSNHFSGRKLSLMAFDENSNFAALQSQVWYPRIFLKRSTWQ